LLYHLNSALQLKPSAISSCQILDGKLLNHAANELQDKTLKNLKDAKSITLTFDGWKNIIEENSSDEEVDSEEIVNELDYTQAIDE
ncbi:15154_t:CDS:2, partial [Racocetra fulgida]